MGIFDNYGKGQHARMKAYYDQLKTERWQGTGRFQGSEPGKNIHLRNTTLLGGIHLLRGFRQTEPKVFTVAKYAVAPIINTTKLGRKARKATRGLRGAASLGLNVPHNTYPDLAPLNPLARVKDMVGGIFGPPSNSKQVLNKYGLDCFKSTEHGNIIEDSTGNISYSEEEFRDLIEVKFRGMGKTHQVRGIIGGLADSIAPVWNESVYVGRPDAFMAYAGFARELTFTLTLAALNQHQLKPMWEKINRIATFVLPQQDPAAPMTRFSGKLCNVTIGNYLDDQLCAMTGFAITPNEEVAWEIGDPEIDHPSLTSPGSVGDKLKEFVRDKKITSKSVFKSIGKTFKKKESGAPEDTTPGNTSRKLSAKQRRKMSPKRYVMPRVVTLELTLRVLGNQVPGDPDQGAPLFNVSSGAYGKLGNTSDPLASEGNEG